MTKRNALLLFGCCLALFAADRVGPPSARPHAGIGVWDPGITQTNIATTICVPDYTKIARSGQGDKYGPVTEATKREVYAREGIYPDGLPRAKSKCCEVDHYYPLELGGENVLENLWPESWEHPYGAHDKDVVETSPHRLVCKGNAPMTLKAARDCLSSDWVAFGHIIGVLK